jgi:hypothetical protein
MSRFLLAFEIGRLPEGVAFFVQHWVGFRIFEIACVTAIQNGKRKKGHL